MSPIKIPTANMILQAPMDWDAATEGECMDLAVHAVEQVCGALTMSSTWKPSSQELALLNQGCAVVLTVWSRQHPAVSLGVSERPIP